MEKIIITKRPDDIADFLEMEDGMQHCVYTNYWTSINNGNFLAYHIIWKGHEATLGLYIEDSKPKSKLKFSQLFGRRNSSVSNELRVEINESLDRVNDDLYRMGVSLSTGNTNDNSVEFIPI
jgi:hypothetical protein